MNPRDEIAGNLATYGGVLTACGTAPVSYFNESNMLLICSMIGAVVAVLGLAFSVWNGMRSYQLQEREYERKRLEALRDANVAER